MPRYTTTLLTGLSSLSSRLFFHTDCRVWTAVGDPSVGRLTMGDITCESTVQSQVRKASYNILATPACVAPTGSWYEDTDRHNWQAKGGVKHESMSWVVFQ